MFWAGSFQVGCDWKHMVAVQFLASSLEPGLCCSSEPCVVASLLERGFVRSREYCRSSGFLFRRSFGSSKLFFARVTKSLTDSIK